MSLSQKHTGKVLVPWFNISEWQTVYTLIYSGTDSDWAKALEILKIWKHRTPLLSAGVEGTLIVLEALLLDLNRLSAYEKSHIFSTSLVRFLNLCAANNDKQGSFYKTALQNDLPKWLVSIRHDIAHSHKIPSQSMLEFSLKFCLEWLKEKYWDVQCENMSDLVAGKLGHKIIDSAFFIYKCMGAEVNEKNKKLMKCISRFMPIKIGKMNRQKVLEKVDEILLKEIKNNREESATKLSFLLIEDLISRTTVTQEDGNKQILPEFFQKWDNLINMMYEAEILPIFVSKLFGHTSNENKILDHREIASLLIKEIFISLTNTEKNIKDEDYIIFNSRNDSMKSKDFANTILQNVSLFTMNFLQEVLEYNNAPDQFVQDSISLVKAVSNYSVHTTDKIFTVEDLKINEEVVVDPVKTNCTTKPSNSRWILIEDTSPYLNLPLGILPHQDRTKNPLLLV